MQEDRTPLLNSVIFTLLRIVVATLSRSVSLHLRFISVDSRKKPSLIFFVSHFTGFRNRQLHLLALFFLLFFSLELLTMSQSQDMTPKVVRKRVGEMFPEQIRTPETGVRRRQVEGRRGKDNEREGRRGKDSGREGRRGKEWEGEGGRSE